MPLDDPMATLRRVHELLTVLPAHDYRSVRPLDSATLGFARYELTDGGAAPLPDEAVGLPLSELLERDGHLDPLEALGEVIAGLVELTSAASSLGEALRYDRALGYVTQVRDRLEGPVHVGNVADVVDVAPR